ncbi:DUF2501 domain-containing protein [Castellaniella caeni]|uniref:DUF2501 domain-containing protein n=1 Tax=Castellaniella caeni TaxID=266123 RepID=UPI00082C7948|nr:DUF2501 domain-containing protein [Castellaniella caeni]
MRKTLSTICLASALSVCLAAPAWSSDLLGSLKSEAAKSLGGADTSSQSTSGLGGLLGGGATGSALGLPGLSDGMAGNAAGVLQYCIQNKYLGGTDATSVKDNLLNKVGLGSAQKQQQDTGYQQGLGGVLSGSNGSSFDFSKVKGELKDKACNYVLENASSLM